MLLEFSISNFKSIRDKVTLNMVPDSIKEQGIYNIFNAPQNKQLLKSAIIYGNNATGKTNLLDGFCLVKYLIKKSGRFSSDKKIPVESFALNQTTKEKPSEFQVKFILDQDIFTYGFSVSQHKVYSEWLYLKEPEKREKKLFIRNEDNYKIYSSEFRKKVVPLIEKTKKNTLFLSMLDIFNSSIAQKIVSWFNSCLTPSCFREAAGYTIDMLNKNPEFKTTLKEFFKIADFAIEDLEFKTEELDLNKAPKHILDFIQQQSSKMSNKEAVITQTQIITKHKIYNTNGLPSNEFENFDLEQESDGTQNFFSISGPVIDAIKNGYILLIDEIEESLHPSLTSFIIKLFNSKYNKRGQLIATTHNLNLLENMQKSNKKNTNINLSELRRDQIIFLYKDEQEATKLQRLSNVRKLDGKGVRNDEDYYKNYIENKYVSLPHISENSLNRIFS